MKRLCYGCLPAVLLMACVAFAQINPLTLIGGAVSTAMDARTTTEVKNDLEITAAVSQRFASDKSVEWKNVSLLVFGQHVVLVGTVSSVEARKRVNEIALADKRVRSVIDEFRKVTAPSQPAELREQGEVGRRQRGVPRVHPVGPVEGQGRDPLGHLVQDFIAGRAHGRLLPMSLTPAKDPATGVASLTLGQRLRRRARTGAASAPAP